MESITNLNHRAISSFETEKSGAAKAFKFNPLDPEFQADPYPTYHHLRCFEPVHRTFMGVWLLTRYTDAKAVLRDSRFCICATPKKIKQRSHYLEQGDFNGLVQATGKWLIYLNPPDHTRLRGLVSKAFSSASVKRLRPQIQEVADELISKVWDKGSMDIMSDFACPLPVKVIAAMLGLPIEDCSKLHRWTDELSSVLDPLRSLEDYERMNKVALEFTDYFKSLIAERQKKPQQDLLSTLIAAKEQDKKLSEEEIVSVCMLLFVAGEETTINLIGNGMLALLRHPDQMQKLKQQPTLIQGAVEELLRYDSPIQLTTRVATENVDINGVTIRAGEKVFVSLGAANRDPARFTDPDHLDITRQDNTHLSFADGIHYCLGAALARLEAEIAINTLVQQLPALKLSTDKLKWRNNVTLRGLKALPIAFTPETAE
ncbi:cytochrome P450 [Scytonema sp. PCC 10023]|uniref:cytochrome P450 n=1 Tax=Scytonema sp. PCC 10023 TaxID=1680591 RepID=UPI0039C71EFF